MKYFEPKHFSIEELVPPEIYEQEGEKAFRLLDREALMMIDGIREFFGKSATINNWHAGGKFKNRGFRLPDCAQGAYLSQHKHGRGFDMDIEGIMASEARQLIIKNQKDPLLSLITVIEDDVNWLHVDNRNIKASKIFLIKP